MLAFVLAGVLVAASGTDSADLQNLKQNSATQTEAVSAPFVGIGTVVELKGKAWATGKNDPPRELAEGDAVYTGETLETGSDTTLQVELNDESLFTLSQNTKMSVNDFVYINGSENVNLAANVVKGVFRYVSGKVEKLNPEKVNIEIPSGTIGIRGTIVVGEIDGENCLVALEPEDGDTPHRIVIFNDAGGKRNEIEITKPGFATRIEGRHLAPKPIFELPQADREKFQQKLPQPPKFPKDTTPGSPERYKHLFNPDQMMERRQKEEARRNLESTDETKNKNNPDKNSGKHGDKDKRSLKDEGESKSGPEPPEGPDGNNGSDFRGQDHEPFRNQPKDLGEAEFKNPGNQGGQGKMPGEIDRRNQGLDQQPRSPRKPFGNFSPGGNPEPQQSGPAGFRGEGMPKNFGQQNAPGLGAGGIQPQNQQKDGAGHPKGGSPRNGPSQKR